MDGLGLGIWSRKKVSRQQSRYTASNGRAVFCDSFEFFFEFGGRAAGPGGAGEWHAAWPNPPQNTFSLQQNHLIFAFYLRSKNLIYANFTVTTLRNIF